MNIINFFQAASDIIFQYCIMLLLHHFIVFGFNSESIVMFVCFCCYLSSAVIFFSFILFVTAKAAEKSQVFAARQIANDLAEKAKKL